MEEGGGGIEGRKGRREVGGRKVGKVGKEREEEEEVHMRFHSFLHLSGRIVFGLAGSGLECQGSISF